MKQRAKEMVYGGSAFARADEGSDSVFYANARFVSHLDEVALATVEQLIGSLVKQPAPVILDLMASWDSHIPDTIRPSKVVGLGLNHEELDTNPKLTETVIQDINANPRLPFPDNAFDIVLNTVSVDYITKPFDVFHEVARVLKPGGQFIVIFSNRMFPEKAVKIWRQSGDQERIIMVEDFFEDVPAFGKTSIFTSQGKPRPQGDKYAEVSRYSDPVFAIYAHKAGGDADRSETVDTVSILPACETDYEERMVEGHPCCPHCQERMKKWAVPQSPFTEWDTDYMFICFNDTCPYLMRGWNVMNEQGNIGFSYRMMYNPERKRFAPVPVPTLGALKEGIIEDH